MKTIKEIAVLRNGEKVLRKVVTIHDIDNEIKSKFLGVEKTDNDGQTYWVVDNPKAVLTIVYDEWREKNEPLYKVSIMRKAKLVSAWEGIYLDEFHKDLSEAAYDYDRIPRMTEGKKFKEYLYGMPDRPDSDDYEYYDEYEKDRDKWVDDNWISYSYLSKIPGCTPEMDRAFMDALDLVEEINWDCRCEFWYSYVPKAKPNDIYIYYNPMEDDEEETQRVLIKAMRMSKFINIAKDCGFRIKVNVGSGETDFKCYKTVQPSGHYYTDKKPKQPISESVKQYFDAIYDSN